MFKMELNSSNITTNITIEAEKNLKIPIAAATMDVKNIVYLLITVVVALTGTIGNLLVIGALMVHKRLRVLSNVFIGNLAVADLHVTAIVNPSIITAVLRPNIFIKYPVLCEVLAVICLVTCLCSLWSMCAISLNRYIAICHRVSYPRIYNRVTVLCYVALMWIYTSSPFLFTDYPLYFFCLQFTAQTVIFDNVARDRYLTKDFNNGLGSEVRPNWRSRNTESSSKLYLTFQ